MQTLIPQQEILPPCNKDAEAAVLGAVLISPVVAPALKWMQTAMFTSNFHRLVWRGVMACVERGAVPDLVTVLDEMDKIESGTQDHYAADMTALINNAPFADNAESYAAIVSEKYQLRRFIRLSETLVSNAYALRSPTEIGAMLMTSVNTILACAPNKAMSGRVTFDDLLDRLYDETHDRQENPAAVIKSGFADLDRLIGGFEPGELIYVAARPGAGKSAWALSLAQQLAARFNRYDLGAVEFFSMEMSMLAMIRRAIASASGDPVLETKLMRAGFRNGDDPDDRDAIDWRAYNQFVHLIGERKRIIGGALAFHEGAMTTDVLALRIMEAKTAYRSRLIIVDQLDRFTDRSREGETARISNISGALKRMAMDLGVTIICLTQLNRNTESRPDHRPQLSDLKQSGNLEQDADMVFALYRPSYYYNTPDDHESYTQWAEMDVLKNRDGDQGVVPLCFEGNKTLFSSWDRERYPVEHMMEVVKANEHA